MSNGREHIFTRHPEYSISPALEVAVDEIEFNNSEPEPFATACSRRESIAREWRAAMDSCLKLRKALQS